MNSITVAGNLAKDPELAYSANGEPICKFSIGSKDKSTSDDVTWHNIVCFRGLAENVAATVVQPGGCVRAAFRFASGGLWADLDGAPVVGRRFACSDFAPVREGVGLTFNFF